MSGRADIGRDARLVDADDVVPPPLNQVMRDRGPGDAAQADDHDIRFLVEFRHALNLLIEENPPNIIVFS